MPSSLARRHGCSREVTHAASWVAGVLTPPAAIASNNTPAKVFSLMPGRSSATAAARPTSATRIASRIASSPSTSSAFGNATGSSCAKPGESASVPTRLASAAPSMPLSTEMVFIGFQAMPYKFSCGMSSGTPSSHVLSRWMAPVSRMTTQVGPNGRVPATHNCGAPDTYRTLAWRPSTSTSRSCFSIWASARSRRPVRSARSSARTSVAIRVIGVVGQRNPAFLGDNENLFAAIAAGTFFPHDRFQHHHHSRLQDEVLVELIAEIGPDHWSFGGVDADAVPQIEMRQPRPDAAVHFRRRSAKLGDCGAGVRHVEHRGQDFPPLVELRLLARRWVLSDDPGAPEVRTVALIRDADIGPQHVACHQFALSRQ